MKNLLPIILAASITISAASVTTAVVVTNNQNKKIKDLESKISTTVELTDEFSSEITVEDLTNGKTDSTTKSNGNNKNTTKKINYNDKNAQYKAYELNKENERHEAVVKQINDAHNFTAAEDTEYLKYRAEEIRAEENRLQAVCEEKNEEYSRCEETKEYVDHICGDPDREIHMAEQNAAIDAKVAKCKSERDQAEKEYGDHCRKYDRYYSWLSSYNTKKTKLKAENELHQKNVNEINKKYA